MSDPPQNIYDDPTFFAGYSELDRFGTGWSAAFEWPAFSRLLPPFDDRRVLDLGCGTGGLAHFVATQGAAQVLGIDISERMLSVARAEYSHPALRFERADIETVSFEPERFDVVLSSLALHYVADYAGLIQRVSEWLTAEGILAFSIEHPVYLSRALPEGWIFDQGRKPRCWTLDRYGEQGEREETWIMSGVRKYHRMLSVLLNDLIRAGLVLEQVVEPMPDQEMLAREPEWIDELKRPFCLLVRARKP